MNPTNRRFFPALLTCVNPRQRTPATVFQKGVVMHLTALELTHNDYRTPAAALHVAGAAYTRDGAAMQLQNQLESAARFTWQAMQADELRGRISPRFSP